MPWPRVVILIADSDAAMLYRYAADGTFAGDTWHENVEEADRAAESEYAESLEGDWNAIPETVAMGQVRWWALGATE